MRRARIRDLALVAVAGGLLAFEAISLQGVLPVAKQALLNRGLLGEVEAAPLGAAFTSAPVLADAGSAAAYAATSAAKGAARLLGTVTEPRSATRSALVVVNHEAGRGMRTRVHVVSMTHGTCRTKGTSCSATLRAREVRRAAENTVRRSTL